MMKPDLSHLTFSPPEVGAGTYLPRGSHLRTDADPLVARPRRKDAADRVGTEIVKMG